MMQRRRSAAWTVALLLLVSAFACAVRLGAIGRLLPVQTEPDDGMVWHTRWLTGEDVYSAHGVYPTLWSHVLAEVAGPSLPAAQDASLDEHLRAASRPWLLMRVLLAVISCLAVPITFLFARRWVEDRWALLAAAFLATALLHVSHSSIAKPHGAHVTLAWLALTIALSLIERPSLWRILAVTAAGVAAVGTLQTGVFLFLPMILAAWFARPANSVERCALWVAPFATVLFGLMFVSCGLNFDAGGVTLGGTGHKIYFSLLDGGGIATWARFLWEQDPAIAVLGAVGLLVAPFSLRGVWRDPPARRRLLVVAAYVLPYLALISMDRHVGDRYLLPLYPVFALLAAGAARAALQRIGSPALQALACAGLLLVPTWIAARFTWIGRQPDTLEQLATWIELQPESRSQKFLISPWIAPPLMPTAEALAQQVATRSGRSQRWIFYLSRLPGLPTSVPTYDLQTIDPQFLNRRKSPDEVVSYIEQEQPQWIVLERSPRISACPGAETLSAVVGQHGDLVAKFPAEGGQINYQDVRHLAKRVMTSSAYGPHLEVYRMHPR